MRHELRQRATGFLESDVVIDSPSISLIIPAAGLSRRHPPNKLLLPLEGETVIQRSVARFIEAPC